MLPNDIILLRRKEAVGTVAWVCWALGLLFSSVLHDAGVFLLIATAWLCTTAWVVLDERLRRKSFTVWPILTMLTGPVGFALYYLTRKPVAPVCSQCGSTMSSSHQACPTCGHRTPMGRVMQALSEVYSSLANSLVKSPVEKAKETAKHLSIALGAMVVISTLLLSVRGLAPLAPLVGVILVLSAAAYWVLLAWWVYLDSLWRKMDGVPWAVLTLVTNLIGLVTYLVIRYPDPRSCVKCGSSVPVGLRYCPACGSEAEAMCPHCQSPVRPGWQFCPACAARLAAPEAAAAVAGDEEVALVVSVTGSVLDATDGSPIAGAVVRVDSQKEGGSAVSDALGKFELALDNSRPYVLVAFADGYVPQAKACSPGPGGARSLRFSLYPAVGRGRAV